MAGIDEKKVLKLSDGGDRALIFFSSDYYLYVFGIQKIKRTAGGGLAFIPANGTTPIYYVKDVWFIVYPY